MFEKKKDQPEDLTMSGMRFNRTGIGTSPRDARTMIEAAAKALPTARGDVALLAERRARMVRDAEPIGTVPPPASLKGLGEHAIEAIKGRRPSVLVDQLGARLAFERSGTRLYEAVLAKHDAQGSWDGGPTREALYQIYAEEFEHFMLLKDIIEGMGADPTAITPAADLVSVETAGISAAIVDPRVTLAQSIHALLVTELADEAGWDDLIRLSRELGEDDLADRGEKAHIEEQRHLALVRSWWHEHTLARARGGLGASGEHPVASDRP